MEDIMKTENPTTKRTLLASFLFYFLIAFEFFYMASPFAGFFYSAYRPVLNFFNGIPVLAWLDRFFLPHSLSETSSVFINSLHTVGEFFAIGGFLLFCIGACKVYYSKLRKKGAVTNGIYRYIRHPQYISFIICSFGLLLMWPRYIVAIMFVTMVFVYYFLAKIEERECLIKFGEPYIEYKNKTNMFLPFKVKVFEKIQLPKSNMKKVPILISIYILSLLAILGMANGLENLSIHSLYSVYSNGNITLAACKLSDKDINRITQLIRSDERTSIYFEENSRYLNYIVPTEWNSAEIPMNLDDSFDGHYSPKNYDTNQYKVIITKVELKDNNAKSTAEALKNVHTIEPIIEVWINLSKEAVTKISEIPKKIRYEGIPVPVW
jgi:protein-S-isoprenylcysteine O-methyltransferase Ste14